MRFAFRTPNIYIVLGIDTLLLFLAYYLSYWLRFDNFVNPYRRFFWETVFIVVGVQMASLSFFGLHKGMWRYTGLVDITNAIKATVVSFAIIMAVIVYLYYPNLGGRVSRSVFVIDAMLSVGLISIFRLIVRLFYSNVRSQNDLLNAMWPGFSKAGGARGANAVIYSADDRGEMLLRSLLSGSSGSHSSYNIVGFLHDNPKMSGASIHGKKVLGGIENLEDLIPRFNIKELLVASRVTGDEMERISEECRRLRLKLRVVPGYLETIRGEVNISSLRNIRIEDLLSRDPISIDYAKLENTLRGRRVLITGAGGSIGSQLALQIAALKPSSMILVDKGENYLHHLELEMSARGDVSDLHFCCVNVTDGRKMESIFECHKPEFVFHAAAHKHVPMMERNKDEAIRNNIGGMKIVADLADKFSVGHFILISTDKAVDPVNIMGATKRICELYLQSKAEKSKTEYMAVRFGNVLGSNGSVVPLFMKQIEARRPLTVTHPDIERYFMTIPEAVLLILQSVTIGRGGELFLLDMGKPVKIADLAEKIIRLAGFEPGKDIDIVFTGLREGEKLKESLVGVRERLEPTSHKSVSRVALDERPWEGVEEKVDQWLASCREDPEKTSDEIIAWIASSASGKNLRVAAG